MLDDSVVGESDAPDEVSAELMSSPITADALRSHCGRRHCETSVSLSISTAVYLLHHSPTSPLSVSYFTETLSLSTFTLHLSETYRHTYKHAEIQARKHNVLQSTVAPFMFGPDTVLVDNGGAGYAMSRSWSLSMSLSFSHVLVP